MPISRAIHDRYHAALRNPYNEIECSDHYARAMASYGAFQAVCGLNCHGPKGHLEFAPRLSPDNFRAAFTSAEAWGTIEQQRDATSQTNTITAKYGQLRLASLAFDVGDRRIASVVCTLGGYEKAVQFDQNQGGASEVIPHGVGKGGVTVNATGTFDLVGFNETINALNLNSGAVAGTGLGTDILTVSGTITSTGSSSIGGSGDVLQLNGNDVDVPTAVVDVLTVNRHILDAPGNTLDKLGDGTLRIGGGATLTTINNNDAGNIEITGGTVDLNNGTINSSGDRFTLAAGGMLEDVNSFVGNLLQTGGTLRTDPAATDMMNIAGNLTQDDGVIEVKVDGDQASGLFDLFLVDGNVILDGTLKIISDLNPGTSASTGFFTDVIVTTAGHTIMASDLALDTSMAPLTGPPFRTWDFLGVNLPGGGQALRLIITPEPASILIWTLIAGLGGLFVRRERSRST